MSGRYSLSMSIGRPRVNRGPAAAAENRQAVLDAARELLADQGYGVPLAAIARRAGVSQGVMYRHFRNRQSLAYAVFEDNFREIESIASSNNPRALSELWRKMLGYAVTDTGFIEMLLAAPPHADAYDGKQRLFDAITHPLMRAQDAGLVPAALTEETLFLGWAMAYGIAAMSQLSPEEDMKRIEQILSLPKLAVLVTPKRTD